MNKLAHTLVLAVFGMACWFLWSFLKLASLPLPPPDASLPAFTAFCIGLRPAMIILPILAAAYCLWICFRKAERLPSWVVFFAVTMSVLVLVALPTLLAAYLPLLHGITRLASR